MYRQVVIYSVRSITSCFLLKLKAVGAAKAAAELELLELLKEAAGAAEAAAELELLKEAAGASSVSAFSAGRRRRLVARCISPSICLARCANNSLFKFFKYSMNSSASNFFSCACCAAALPAEGRQNLRSASLQLPGTGDL